MDTRKFLKYLFNTNPGTEFSYYLEIGILIFVLISISVAFSIIYDHRKKHDFAFKNIFRKTATKLFLFGIFFLFLLGVRNENIQYFSMRIWLYLSILGLAYFLFKTLKKYRVDYRKEKQNSPVPFSETAQKEVKKYLPNKKRR